MKSELARGGEGRQRSLSRMALRASWREHRDQRREARGQTRGGQGGSPPSGSHPLQRGVAAQSGATPLPCGGSGRGESSGGLGLEHGGSLGRMTQKLVSGR
jgi:hypothetical protein